MYDICSMLTKKQKNLLLFINKKIRSTGVSPSYEEMKNSLNLKSKSGIHRLISALEERGFIRRLAHKARALEVLKLPETASANDIYNSFSPSIIKGGLDENNKKNSAEEIPVLGKIAAGTPIEAIQNEVSRIVLPEELSKNGEHFGLKICIFVTFGSMWISKKKSQIKILKFRKTPAKNIITIYFLSKNVIFWELFVHLLCFMKTNVTISVQN